MGFVKLKAVKQKYKFWLRLAKICKNKNFKINKTRRIKTMFKMTDFVCPNCHTHQSIVIGIDDGKTTVICMKCKIAFDKKDLIRTDSIIERMKKNNIYNNSMKGRR